MKRVPEIAVVAFLFAGTAAGAEGSLIFAERGRVADSTIVVPQAADETVRYAAEELRDFTERTTGVKLPIVTGDGGALGDGGLPAKAIVLEVGSGVSGTERANGEDGFRLKAEDGRLRVIGGNERGVLYGVYELLERYAGCRWYAPWHTVAPMRERIEVPTNLDAAEHPAFLAREVYWYDVLKHPEFAARLRLNARAWCRTEAKFGGEPWRFGGGLDLCHTFEKLMPAKEFFDAHPEYFSMVCGARTGKNSQLCLTNPDVLRIVTERVLARIRKDPDARFFGVSQNDNSKRCTCPDCKAVDDEEGSPAGTIVRFVNAVAEAVEREFPGKMIETLAYQYSRKSPKMTRLRHNVVPCLCTIDCDFALPLDRSLFKENVSFRKDIEAWAAQTDGLYIWDYTTDFSHYAMPFANVRTLQGNLQFFRTHGAKYIYEEGDHGGRHGDFAELKTWLLAKWLWNPDLPEAALLDDFFSGYYGAGAPFVRRYFDELHRHQAEWSSAASDRPLKIFSSTDNPALSDVFFANAAKIWAQAAEAVKDDPACAYNVWMGAFSVDYVRLSRSAKVFRFTDAGALSTEENRALAKSLLARMDEAGDIRLALNRGVNDATVKKWRSIADGLFTPSGVADKRVEVEERHLNLSNPGTYGAFVEDPLAEDGKALKLFNTHFDWCTTFGMGNGVFRPGVKYTVSIRARVETQADGEAFWAGVHDGALEKGRGGIEPRTSDVSADYRWYDVLTWKPRLGEYLWIGPGRFNADGKSAITALWIDKIAFRYND